MIGQAFVEGRIARFIVCGVDQYAFVSLDPKSQAALRMIQPRCLNADAVFHIDASVLDVAEVALRSHRAEIDRKVR